MLRIDSKHPARSSHRTYRLIRQLHLWIGAWGAIAAILYGITGLVLNHRIGDGAWPQGESNELAKQTLPIPEVARSTPEALSIWLRQTQSLDAQVIRKGGPPGRGGDAGTPPKWNLSGGTARESWSLEYSPGDPTAQIKHSRQTFLAGLNRLHKTIGGGWAWTLLADSFAVSMLLLGISGVWMWARGRTPRQMALSVLAASCVVLALILVPALS